MASRSGNYKREQRQLAVAVRGTRCENPDCPTPFHPQWGTKAFHFDHIIPIIHRTGNKKNSRHGREDQGTMYHRIAEGNAPDIQMLCANCHFVKSHDERYSITE